MEEPSYPRPIILFNHPELNHTADEHQGRPPCLTIGKPEELKVLCELRQRRQAPPPSAPPSLIFGHRNHNHPHKHGQSGQQPSRTPSNDWCMAETKATKTRGIDAAIVNFYKIIK